MGKLSKEEQAKASKKHYAANKEKIKERAKAFTAAQIVKNREYVNNIKSQFPCTDCKQYFFPVMLDFDHTGNDKTRNIADMVARGCSIKTIQSEIDKCQIVCANCHRLRTFLRKEGFLI
jgi:hypothetical protein